MNLSKLELSAFDKKIGMTLDELKDVVDKFYAVAKINETDTSNSKVTAFVNIHGGIKQLIAEV